MHKFTAEVYRYYNAAVHSTHSHPAPLQLPTDTQFAFSEWNTEDSQILRQYTSTSGDKISVSKVYYCTTTLTTLSEQLPRLAFIPPLAPPTPTPTFYPIRSTNFHL